MKKSLLLISIWIIFFCGSCNNNHREENQTTSDTTSKGAQQNILRDSVSPSSIGAGNSNVMKDTSKKSTKKFYPVPVGNDEKKLDSLKKANDEIKKH